LANTYTQISIQVVFAVKHRNALIKPSFKEELQRLLVFNDKTQCGGNIKIMFDENQLLYLEFLEQYSDLNYKLLTFFDQKEDLNKDNLNQLTTCISWIYDVFNSIYSDDISINFPKEKGKPIRVVDYKNPQNIYLFSQKV